MVVIVLCICILEVEYKGSFFSEIWTSLIMHFCKEKEKIVYQKADSKSKRGNSKTNNSNDSAQKVDSDRTAEEMFGGALEQIEMTVHDLT